MLEINNLQISFSSTAKPVVENLSISVRSKETLAIVGESGSGKSITSLAVMGLLPKSATVTGSIRFNKKEILHGKEKDLRALRGKRIAMIFQEPMTALNPSLTCGAQCAEPLLLHLKLNKKEAKQEVLRLFEKVKIPDPKRAYNAYPHQLSGGQRQRVMIAMAISCKPDLLIADEPTTALDVTVQKEILLLLKTLQEETGMAMIFISHDLGVVKLLANKVVVMYRGKVMESGTADEVLSNPQSGYTKGLLACKPPMQALPHRLPTIQQFLKKEEIATTVKSKEQKIAEVFNLEKKEPLLEVRNVDKWFGKNTWFSKGNVTQALNNVSFKVYPSETLGLVGESGCGKSTLGKSIVGLLHPQKGEIIYKGKDLTQLSKKERQAFNKEIQVIFQDPFSSLNPRQRVGDCILEPMQVHGVGPSKKRKSLVEELLVKVGLSVEDYKKYPHEFSGGQRQRIGIARALALRPQLIICDESVSALDVSVQAQVLNLLNDLKEEYQFTYIFISHDLSVVKYMSDHLVVMNAGKVEEQGQAEEIFAAPQKEYTKKLINAILK